MNSESLFIKGVAIFLIGAATFGDVRAQRVSMEEALRLAQDHSVRISQSEARVAQKHYDARAAEGRFFPTVQIDGGFTALNDPLAIDLDPLRSALIDLEVANRVELADLSGRLAGLPPLTAEQRAVVAGRAAATFDDVLPPFRQALKDQFYPSAAVTVVQPILSGGKIVAGNRAARAEHRASEAELERTRDEVAEEVIDRYMTVVLLRNVVSTRQDVCTGIRQHLDRARVLHQEGFIPTSDVLRAEVAVAEAERNLHDDQMHLSLAETAFAYAVGLPEASPAVTDDTLEFIPLGDSLDTFMQAIAVEQPLLRLIREKGEAAQQKVVAERAAYFPQLALFGRYELFPTYLSALDPEWAVGVKASFSLFDGFQRRSRLQSARSLRREVDYLQDQTREQFALLVTRHYQDLRRAEEKHRQLGADLRLAEENLRLSERRYETGLGTMLDVIDARLVWERNRIERLTSLYEYLVSMNHLFTAVGQPDRMSTLWNAKSVAP